MRVEQITLKSMKIPKSKTVLKRRINKLFKSIKREGISILIKFLNNSDYFNAPASTRFHGNYSGGLAAHCYAVYLLFKNKNKKFNLGLSEQSIILCSFLHDLCKVNVYFEKFLKNGEKSRIPYEYEENLPLGHSTKSLFIISKFLKLKEEEAIIIRWHMSWSDYEFKKHIEIVKIFAPSIIAFICSDLEASSYLV